MGLREDQEDVFGCELDRKICCVCIQIETWQNPNHRESIYFLRSDFHSQHI